MKRNWNVFLMCFCVVYLSVPAWVGTAGNGRGVAEIGLTLIPPTEITDRIDLDIRAGITHPGRDTLVCDVVFYLDREEPDSLLYREKVKIGPGEGGCVRFRMDTEGRAGERTVVLCVEAAGKKYRKMQHIRIISSDVRSTRTLGGAWIGFYHWSEAEGKRWNADIRRLTDRQWRQVIRSMHRIGLDIVVVQEVFRNQAYVGQHELTCKTYPGRAFYPSRLYPARMPVAARDPQEAVLSEADRLGMPVWVGVGLFAWFDFSSESLEWHKRVARELWEQYGHHASFYGFYISEESYGNLDNGATTDREKVIRKQEIVRFFTELKAWCGRFAPGRPLMLSTNSMEVPAGADTYPALLEQVDVLCPFGFARMPPGDLTGAEAAALLQDYCDRAGAHLWFDLEAFLFDADTALYPRDLPGIAGDLSRFDRFEKVLCYQYPGVFSDPEGVRVGGEETCRLYRAYEAYRKEVEKNRRK